MKTLHAPPPIAQIRFPGRIPGPSTGRAGIFRESSGGRPKSSSPPFPQAAWASYAPMPPPSPALLRQVHHTGTTIALLRDEEGRPA